MVYAHGEELDKRLVTGIRLRVNVDVVEEVAGGG